MSFSDFEPDEARVETFFYHLLHLKKQYKKLGEMIQIVLLLSHYQASVERGARQKYQMYLDEQKRTKEVESKKHARKDIEEEISEVKNKRRGLNEDIASMKKSANSLAEKAEAKSRLSLIAKSNSLRRSVANKKTELKNVEKNYTSWSKNIRILRFLFKTV